MMVTSTDRSAAAQAFVSELEQELRDTKASLLDGDFLAAIESGEASKAQIEIWARMFYAYTKNGRLSIGNFYANSPDDPDLRRELAANIWEEETGRISGIGRCHMDVFTDFLGAFGITPEAAAELSTGVEHRMGRVIEPDDFWVELIAYGFSVEVPNSEWSQRIFDALRTNYDFTEAELRWFSMHSELDADHGEEFRKYVERVVDDPATLERVRSETLAMSALVRDVWNANGVWADAS